MKSSTRLPPQVRLVPEVLCWFSGGCFLLFLEDVLMHLTPQDLLFPFGLTAPPVHDYRC